MELDLMTIFSDMLERKKKLEAKFPSIDKELVYLTPNTWVNYTKKVLNHRMNLPELALLEMVVYCYTPQFHMVGINEKSPDLLWAPAFPNGLKISYRELARQLEYTYAQVYSAAKKLSALGIIFKTNQPHRSITGFYSHRVLILIPNVKMLNKMDEYFSEQTEKKNNLLYFPKLKGKRS